MTLWSFFCHFQVFERPDDLGTLGTPSSLTDGNVGNRMACCVIGRADPSTWPGNENLANLNQPRNVPGVFGAPPFGNIPGQSNPFQPPFYTGQPFPYPNPGVNPGVNPGQPGSQSPQGSQPVQPNTQFNPFVPNPAFPVFNPNNPQAFNPFAPPNPSSATGYNPASINPSGSFGTSQAFSDFPRQMDAKKKSK